MKENDTFVRQIKVANGTPRELYVQLTLSSTWKSSRVRRGTQSGFDVLLKRGEKEQSIRVYQPTKNFTVMGTLYTLQRKKNPQKRDEPGKWYAVPKSSKPLRNDVMSQMATEDTTIADVELEASAKLLARWIKNQLLQGTRVKVPGLGTFRITFSSDGVDDIRDFHAGLIHDVKISFIADAALRADLLQKLTFENAGVEDEGVYYGSLDNYKEVKGLKEPSGSGGGEEEERPGGL